MLPKLLSSLSELPKLEPSSEDITDHGVFVQFFAAQNVGTRGNSKIHEVLTKYQYICFSHIFPHFSNVMFAGYISEPILWHSPGSELESPCSTISTGTSRIALGSSLQRPCSCVQVRCQCHGALSFLATCFPEYYILNSQPLLRTIGQWMPMAVAVPSQFESHFESLRPPPCTEGAKPCSKFWAGNITSISPHR